MLKDHLGPAAESKEKAKIAIKEKRFDDAWRHLNEQKTHYLMHASRMGFTELQTLLIDSSVHVDMANIQRLEGKHLQALTNLSYVYKAHYSNNKINNGLDTKLNTYFNRAYKDGNFVNFKKLLHLLNSSDYISVRDFVEIYFSQSLNNDEDLTEESELGKQEVKKVNENFLKQKSAVRNKEHIGIPPPLSCSPIKSIPNNKEHISYPEPKYPTTMTKPQENNSSFLGYPISEWVIGVIVGFMMLIGFIWLLS